MFLTDLGFGGITWAALFVARQQGSQFKSPTGTALNHQRNGSLTAAGKLK